MKLKYYTIKSNPYDPKDEGGFPISLPRNSIVYGLLSDNNNTKLICAIDETKKEVDNHIFIWMKEGDDIADFKRYNYIGYLANTEFSLFEVYI